MELDFEWDDSKAKSNLEKHGIDFDDAIEVFADVLRVLWLDERRDYGEVRFVTVGRTCSGDVLTVVYTERDEKLRLISARRANGHERELYHEG